MNMTANQSLNWPVAPPNIKKVPMKRRVHRTTSIRSYTFQVKKIIEIRGAGKGRRGEGKKRREEKRRGRM